MTTNKTIITGGSGRLGTELKKIWPYEYYPTHKELDITKLPIKKGKYFAVVHCAGYTNVARAEKEIDKCFDINVTGTKNMVKAYLDTPFVFISTEYATSNLNVYSRTKWLAEREVIKHPRHLIIRTLFKPRPYPFDRAWVDQITMGDYVDVIAKLIKSRIMNWDGKSKLIYVGTGRKSIYDLAKQTRPDVKKESVDVITWVKLPKDYI